VRFVRDLAHRWTAERTSLIAAGVAFYCLFALLPALGAAAGVYTLVVGEPPRQPEQERILEVVPEQMRDLVEQHLDTMREASATTITLSALAALLTALWSASAAVKHLLDALAPETTAARLSYVHARLTGLVLTMGLLVFLCAALALTAILPRYLEASSATAVATGVLRWPLLWGAMLLVSATLSRVARWRAAERGRFFTAGSLIAASLWLAGSAGFSALVAFAPRVATSYGSLTTAIVALMWFWLFAGALLLGSHIDRSRQDGRETLAAAPSAAGASVAGAR
jgi:membrane protein